MAVRIEINNGYFGQTYTNNDGTEFVERGLDFELIEVAEDIDTGDIHYTVRCKKLGRTVEFGIPKKHAMDRKRILEYAREGLDVTGSNVSIVPEVFSIKEVEYVENNLPISEVHSVAGIKKVDDGAGGISYIYAGDINPINGSKYIGHLNLKPVGDKEAWFSFVGNELRDSTEISFIVALSFTPIVHSILQDDTDVDNFFVHMRGDSSTGKTSMLCLAASTFGPGTDKDPRGIISSWNGTKNAILRRLMNVNGMLMGLDEVSMNREKDFTGLLYSISSGIEKDRLTKDAQVQERLIGKYIVLSTGEASLLAKTNGNIGLAMRVLEFDNHQWTKSATQAERIKRFCKKNSGHGAPEFGLKMNQYIQEKGLDYVFQQYEYWRNFYCKRCTIQARKERMSGRYALILLTAQYLNRFFDFGIIIPKLCQFIIDNENSNGDDRDSYDDFYNKLISYVVMNRQHFDDESHNLGVDYRGGVASVQEEMKKHKALEPWGEFSNLAYGHILPTGDVSYKTVSITCVAFEKIVTKELGYEDSKALRKYLKGKGLLIYEKDRDYIRKHFRGVRTNMVEVYMPTDEYVNEDEARWLAKEKIKENLKILDNMASIGFAERTRRFKELKDREEYMTKTEAKKYQNLLEERKQMSKLKLLFDEEVDGEEDVEMEEENAIVTADEIAEEEEITEADEESLFEPEADEIAEEEVTETEESLFEPETDEIAEEEVTETEESLFEPEADEESLFEPVADETVEEEITEADEESLFEPEADETAEEEEITESDEESLFEPEADETAEAEESLFEIEDEEEIGENDEPEIVEDEVRGDVDDEDYT